MTIAKKIQCKEIQQGYMPKSIPEIIKLAKYITEEQAVVYHSENRPFLFETNRLIIRRFSPNDFEAVCVLANDKESSPLANCDHKWPTDLDSSKGIAEFFSNNDTFWAVCLKPSFTLIGMITFNTVDEHNMVDLGHVWRMHYMRNELDTESISLMVQYAFENLGVEGVFANNAYDYKEQLHPLEQIGMEIVEMQEGSFVNDNEGNPIIFQGCKMVITKDAWIKNHK